MMGSLRFFLLTAAIVLLAGTATYKIIAGTREASNNVMAQITLKKISNALEKRRGETGKYPASMDNVVIDEYPYRASAYFEGDYYGYKFSYDISPYTYILRAAPVSGGNQNGQDSFKITTGGDLQEEKNSGQQEQKRGGNER